VGLNEEPLCRRRRRRAGAGDDQPPGVCGHGLAALSEAAPKPSSLSGSMLSAVLSRNSSSWARARQPQAPPVWTARALGSARTAPARSAGGAPRRADGPPPNRAMPYGGGRVRGCGRNGAVRCRGRL